MVASLLTLSLLVPGSGEVSMIAQNGVSRYSIFVPASAPAQVAHAAAELHDTLRKMTGADLPVVTSDSKGPAIRFRVDPKMAAEEYRIRTTSRGLEISGGLPRGVVYGSYALLEDVFGVRWFTAKVSHIPSKPTLALPNVDIHGKPAFEYREPYYTEAWDGDWALRNRVNGNSQRLDAAHGGRVSYGPFVHTFAEICPPEKYFATHPEYFSMIDGVRKNGYYQLCLTNPDLIKIAVEKVEEWIQDNPTATIFSVSQNDTYFNCQCPACKAVEAEEGAPSGALIRFVNAVAEQVEKRHPNVLIDTLAYQWSEKPPLLARPRTNVRIRIAPISACFSHPLDGCAENKQPLANLQNWAKVTQHIYIWHYTTNFANYLQPLPNLDEIAGDLKLFAKSGVVGVFDEGAYGAGGGGEMAELKSYLLAKLMWDPAQSAKKLTDEFVRGVYGKGAPYISRWLDLIHASGRAMKSHGRIYDPPTAPYLDDTVLKLGDAFFSQAEWATQEEPAALDAVQRARLSLEYVELMRTPRTEPKFGLLAKTVADKIRRYGIGEIREGQPSGEFLKSIGQ